MQRVRSYFEDSGNKAFGIVSGHRLGDDLFRGMGDAILHRLGLDRRSQSRDRNPPLFGAGLTRCPVVATGPFDGPVTLSVFALFHIYPYSA